MKILDFSLLKNMKGKKSILIPNFFVFMISLGIMFVSCKDEYSNQLHSVRSIPHDSGSSESSSMNNNQSSSTNSDISSDNNQIEEAPKTKSKSSPITSIRSFVIHMYNSNMLFDKSCQCFTEGTYVIEDNDGRVFDLLIKNSDRSSSFGSGILNKSSEGTINDVSSSMKLDNFKYKKEIHGTYNIDSKKWESQRMKLGKSESGLLTFKTYEYELCTPMYNLCHIEDVPKMKCEKKTNKNCKCDKCKRKKCEAKKSCKCKNCKKDGKDPRRAILFARFKTRNLDVCEEKDPCDKKEDPKLKGSKTYVVIALLPRRSRSPKNMSDGVKSTFSNQYIKSRKGSEKLKVNLDAESDRLVGKLSDENEKMNAKKSMDYYNKHIRVGNEMFIPQEITDELFLG